MLPCLIQHMPSVVSFGQSVNEPQDQAIIDSVRATYASLPYYADSTVICNEARLKNPCGRTFSSAFIRSRYYEIEGRRSTYFPDVWIKAGIYINHDQGQSLTWVHRGSDPVEIDTKELDIGIARLVGTFGGALSMISDLLLPDSLSSFKNLEAFNQITRLPDEILEDEDCYVLDLDYPIRKHSGTNGIRGVIESIPPSTIENDLKLWIRKSDFMILKYDKYIKVMQPLNTTVRIFPQLKRAAKLEPRPFLYSSHD